VIKVKRLLVLGIAAVIVLGALPVFGAYPERPITIICPWAAGGGTDRITRALALELSEILGVPVGVTNVTGGAGVVGHTAGAQAAPDGYTLTMVTLEICLLHWQGLTDLTYEAFEPIALVNADYSAITVRADSPWKTYEDLHAYIKEHPGKLLASGSGAGSIWDLARAGWLLAAGFGVNDVGWVPTTGAAPSLQELIAGGVDLVTCSLAEAIPVIESGEAKCLAFMGPERHPSYPDVPTLRELGIPWEAGTWRGLGAPKGTPPEIIKVLEAAVTKAVQSQRFVDFMQKNGFGIRFLTAQDFGKFMADEDKKWGEVLRQTGFAKP
jgi:tripartite-type tricarboxylate transporter receptor subunit TctC